MNDHPFSLSLLDELRFSGARQLHVRRELEGAQSPPRQRCRTHLASPLIVLPRFQFLSSALYDAFSAYQLQVSVCKEPQPLWRRSPAHSSLLIAPSCLLSASCAHQPLQSLFQAFQHHVSAWEPG
jgi:hypothetical protein